MFQGFFDVHFLVLFRHLLTSYALIVSLRVAKNRQMSGPLAKENEEAL